MSSKAGRGSDQFMIRLPDGLRDRLKAASDYNGRSMNAEAVRALEMWLDGVDHDRELERYYAENPPEANPHGYIEDNEFTDDDVDKWVQERTIRSASDVDKAVDRILRDHAARLKAEMMAAFEVNKRKK